MKMKKKMKMIKIDKNIKKKEKIKKINKTKIIIILINNFKIPNNKEHPMFS